MEIYVHMKVIPREGPLKSLALGPALHCLTCKWVKQLKERVRIDAAVFLMTR